MTDEEQEEADTCPETSVDVNSSFSLDAFSMSIALWIAICFNPSIYLNNQVPFLLEGGGVGGFEIKNRKKESHRMANIYKIKFRIF